MGKPMKDNLTLNKKPQKLIRACHVCLKLNESDGEIEKCSHCNKSFLPLRYFEKIHGKSKKDWAGHFSSIDDIDQKDLIKGLFVMW
jgi:hypothetical protein